MPPLSSLVTLYFGVRMLCWAAYSQAGGDVRVGVENIFTAVVVISVKRTAAVECAQQDQLFSRKKTEKKQGDCSVDTLFYVGMGDMPAPFWEQLTWN